MRNRRRALGALTVLLLAAPAAHAASGESDRPGLRPGADPAARGERFALPHRPMIWTDDLTIDRTGDVRPDGSVTLYGSYRCVRDGSQIPRASVLVTLTQGQERHGLGGYDAVCDGLRHRWVIDGVGVGRYVRGPADAEGTLLKYAGGDTFAPTAIPTPVSMPMNVARADREVMLLAADD
ncbi:DUF6299 family protein [Streptomyces hygroscopicus]|uniref:DUF6299 family protein n=1 Tax=Streptomyces hygroscopicus TaxID=1912 RepID=UPI000832B0BA|nr:DUF6299 family protein [Streptomyces hygroscopicus]GLV79087.1 hypothetical protein Shyhy02_70870 [Streptomyces hygroscopicus subsp. hygroscopicus]